MVTVPLVLADSAGKKWSVTPNADGLLVATLLPLSSTLLPASLVLTSGTSNWGIGITTDGLLFAAPVANNGQGSFNFGNWLLSITGSGLLQTQHTECLNNGIILQDAQMESWLMQITNDGLLQTTQVSGGVPAVVVLQSPSDQGWIVGVNQYGMLTTTRTYLRGTSAFLLGSCCCETGWNLGVTVDGLLYSARVPGWTSGPVVGSLYPQNAGYPQGQQPLGVGTPVANIQQAVNRAFGFPGYVQYMSEFNGRFYPGCGHSIMMWDLKSALVCGNRACLVTCSLCGYIQQTIIPYDLINDPSPGSPYACIFG